MRSQVLYYGIAVPQLHIKSFLIFARLLLVQWIPVIRTSLGVKKMYYYIEKFRFPGYGSYIRNIQISSVLIADIHCIWNRPQSFKII